MNDRQSPQPLVLTLIATAQAIEGKLDAALVAAELSLAKFGVLDILARNGSPMSLSELAEKAACVKSNITQMVDRLEAEGLVRREPDTNDRRVVRAGLTPLGRTRHGAGEVAMAEAQGACLSALPEGDRAALNWALRRLQ